MPINKQLVAFFNNAISAPDLYTGSSTGYSKGYLVKLIEDFLAFLKVPNIGSDNMVTTLREEMPPLSARQLFCSSACFRHCRESNVGLAIHELLDCIDNYGEIHKRERDISPEEHVLYWGMATTILLTIKHTIV